MVLDRKQQEKQKEQIALGHIPGPPKMQFLQVCARPPLALLFFCGVPPSRLACTATSRCRLRPSLLQVWVLREYLAFEFASADWSKVHGGFDLEQRARGASLTFSDLL